MTDLETPALSLLDLVPVRTGQTSPQAVSASMALAQRADELGYRRYWYAEHHNMAAIASSTPPVLIAGAAARTQRIRLGSGGVMLPNHSPLIVAEQFATLESLAPGRIDLGLGRAPGSDPVITQLLRRAGTTSEAQQFPENVRDILDIMGPDGAEFGFRGGGSYQARATPAAASMPTTWLLGSSDFSARLAAQLGLPYVFANHFGAPGLAGAMALYRDSFQPSERHPEPQSFVTLNASVAGTEDEAHERALPMLRQGMRLRTNQPMRPLETVEEAHAAEVSESEQALIDSARESWFIGTAEQVGPQLAEFARTNGVDEVMISGTMGSYESEPMDRAVGAEQMIALLAGALPQG